MRRMSGLRVPVLCAVQLFVTACDARRMEELRLFESNHLDLGKVHAPQHGIARLRFTNRSPSVLRIIGWSADCACLAGTLRTPTEEGPAASSQPVLHSQVPPGATALLILEFGSLGKSGDITSHALLVTEDADGRKETAIKVRQFVVPEFDCTPQSVRLKSPGAASSRSFDVRIVGPHVLMRASASNELISVALAPTSYGYVCTGCYDGVAGSCGKAIIECYDKEDRRRLLVPVEILANQEAEATFVPANLLSLGTYDKARGVIGEVRIQYQPKRQVQWTCRIVASNRASTEIESSVEEISSGVARARLLVRGDSVGGLLKGELEIKSVLGTKRVKFVGFGR